MIPAAPPSLPIVVAITGASGAVYATRLLQILSRADRQVHLTISPSGAAVVKQELGLTVDIRRPDLGKLLSTVPEYVRRQSFLD